MKKLILIALSVLLIVSLVGCAKKEAADDCRIVVAKTSDALDAGTALSAEDAASLMAQIISRQRSKLIVFFMERAPLDLYRGYVAAFQGLIVGSTEIRPAGTRMWASGICRST